jgi:hypothetical protein
MLRYDMLRYDMLRYVTLRYVMLRYDKIVIMIDCYGSFLILHFRHFCDEFFQQ